jgi:hypothetical protein
MTSQELSGDYTVLSVECTHCKTSEGPEANVTTRKLYLEHGSHLNCVTVYLRFREPVGYSIQAIRPLPESEDSREQTDHTGVSKRPYVPFDWIPVLRGLSH